MTTEADTCRKYITPALHAVGWDDPPHSIAQERTFTDGRIVLVGDKIHHLQQKRADYLLRYRRDFTLAVVEAKAEDHAAAEGMQQAKEYAEILGLKFAYATNGLHVLEFDFTTGLEREVDRYPTPDELFTRWRQAEGVTGDAVVERLLTPYSIVAYLDDLQARVEAVKQHQAATGAALDALLPSILDRAFKGES